MECMEKRSEGEIERERLVATSDGESEANEIWRLMRE